MNETLVSGLNEEIATTNAYLRGIGVCEAESVASDGIMLRWMLGKRQPYRSEGVWCLHVAKGMRDPVPLEEAEIGMRVRGARLVPELARLLVERRDAADDVAMREAVEILRALREPRAEAS